MHFPILVLTSESHRGLSAAVAAVSVDWNRTWRCGGTIDVIGRKSAERATSVRIAVCCPRMGELPE